MLGGLQDKILGGRQMTQTATVTAIPGPGLAEVTVARQTACGHDCEHCAGCGMQAGTMTVLAATQLPLSPGDRVELYSSSGRVLPIAALVYLAPVILFLVGYLFPGEIPEWGRGIAGAAGFLAGLVGAVIVDRRLRRSGGAVNYQVTRKL